jgi:hypothetical protein
MKRRYCGPCDEYTNSNPCKKCGADTDKMPPKKAMSSNAGATPSAQGAPESASESSPKTVTGETPEGWQPIETAPKDGTPVRLKWESTTVEATGRWCRADKWPQPFSTDDWRDVKGDDVLLMPTHWMPIPPSPQEERP